MNTSDNFPAVEETAGAMVYPTLLERVKALTVDNAIVIALVFVVSMALLPIENAPNSVRVVCFALILLYAPLLTAFWGGTIGHKIFRLGVKREENEERNISLPLAIVRYIAKIVLGWISLVAVSLSPRGRAIHDQLTGSILIYVGDLKK